LAKANQADRSLFFDKTSCLHILLSFYQPNLTHTLRLIKSQEKFLVGVSSPSILNTLKEIKHKGEKKSNLTVREPSSFLLPSFSLFLSHDSLSSPPPPLP
jgi:hypothetical protein